MSRDQKSRAKPKSAGRNGGGVLVGIFIGLLMGAVVAAVAAWYFMRSAPVRPPVVPPRTTPQTVPGTPESAPAPLPGKPGDRPVEKPQFDFYKILPQGENAAPEPGKPVSGTSPDTAKAPAAPAASERLYLQVGAFEDPAEADNLKARLALMGIEASSQKVEVADKGTLHRVRVGPYAKAEDMNAVRAQLAQAGIPVAVVKNKP